MATPTLPSVRPAADAVPGRNETPLERCDRNLTELLAEVRVVQTGVQVLLAFLLVAPLNARFGGLSSFQRGVFFATLITTATAAVLLIAPTAHHRVLFRCGDKEHLWPGQPLHAAGARVRRDVDGRRAPARHGPPLRAAGGRGDHGPRHSGLRVGLGAGAAAPPARSPRRR